MRRMLSLLCLSLAILAGGPVLAQTLSEDIYRRLERIHAHIGDEEYDPALQKLDRLLPAVRREPYAQALVRQTLGIVHARQGRYREAAEQFRQALALDALPAALQESMQYQLAQFLVAEEAYPAAIKLLETYLREAQSPVPPEARVLLAQAHAQLEQYRQALGPLREAIEAAGTPPESWYQLQLALQFQLKDYPGSARTLRTLISRYPLQAAYWKQLSGIFLELKRDREALAILALARRQGHLEAGAELRNLANLFLHLEIPYKAGEILQQALDSGVLAATAANFERLANAWLAARETARAIQALEIAARQTDNAKLLLRLARLHLERENWAKVLATLERARRLDFNDDGQPALLRGIAATELGRYGDALAAFERAASFDNSREQAQAWRQYALGLRAENGN